MKVVAFTVRVECENCHGSKRISRGQPDRPDPNGETLPCWGCDGLGHVEAVVPWVEFEKLIRGLANL